MKYRNFGKIDFKVSALGFGAMRLPIKDGDSSNIAMDNAVEMIRYAIDNGVNYIDTAWPYHQGNSEKLVGQALKNGYREKTKIATKMPSWLLEEQKDLDNYLNKQLKKLDVNYIDFYLLHALNPDHWNTYKSIDVFSWIEKVKKEGKIKYIGFSFHSEYECFKEIIDDYDWDFCQIQYNYLDTLYQAGEKGLKYAYQNGLAIVVMEPLLGGALAQDPPAKVKEILTEANINKSMADLALQWLWNQPEVSVVLSGMSTMKQVKENIESACKSQTNSLSDKELKVIDKISDKMRGPISCTRCAYCMPCPNDINIPHNFYLYNQANVYDKHQENKKRYNNMDEKKKAENCIKCGQCEPACPQNLNIMDLLDEVASCFSN